MLLFISLFKAPTSIKLSFRLHILHSIFFILYVFYLFVILEAQKRTNLREKSINNNKYIIYILDIF